MVVLHKKQSLFMQVVLKFRKLWPLQPIDIYVQIMLFDFKENNLKCLFIWFFSIVIFDPMI